MAGDLQRVFAALEQARVRYLVVGGVAVVLHGHPRFTADVDVVVGLDAENVKAALAALGALGYRPRAPISAEGLADPAVRRQWVAEKGLTVLSFWSPSIPATDVDVFVEEPFPFEAAFGRAVVVELEASRVRVASIRDLIESKRSTGRPKDAEDIRALEAIERETGGSGGS